MNELNKKAVSLKINRERADNQKSSLMVFELFAGFALALLLALGSASLPSRLSDTFPEDFLASFEETPA
jgi:hypothetical protein